MNLLELPHVDAGRLVATGAPVWLTVNPVELSLHYAPRSVSPAYVTLPPCPDVTPRRDFVAAARLARKPGGFARHLLDAFAPVVSRPYPRPEEVVTGFPEEGN